MQTSPSEAAAIIETIDYTVAYLSQPDAAGN